MKYLVLVVLVIAVWTLLEQSFRAARVEGGSIVEQLKELGRNLHFMIGLIALLILVAMAARLIYSAFK